MFWDLFRGVRFRASPATFEQLRAMRHPAYKYEYLDGEVILSPRPACGRAVLRLDRDDAPRYPGGCVEEVRTRPLRETDWPALAPLLGAAFASLPPYSTLPEKERERAAAESIAYLHEGNEGPLLGSACYVAEEPDRAGLVGAVLITLSREGLPPSLWRAGDGAAPHLTWALVPPLRQRRGIGTALLAAACTHLRRERFPALASTLVLGNTPATLWHWRCGFELLPSLRYV